MHFRFENPLALWGLVGVFLLTALMIYKGRKLPGSFSARRFFLGTLAFLACVLGLARPQWGTRVTTVQGRQANLFIAVDVSQSMLAQDVGPSRLAFSVTYARKLLEKLPGLKVAIFPFTLDGYLLIPLTTDIPAASDMLTSLNPGMTSAQGTDITGALETLLRTILRMEANVKEKGGEWSATQVLLFSDGESHHKIDEDIVRLYRQRHIPIFTVGAGSTYGTTIPAESRAAWQPHELVRDREGKTVVSKLHPETLKRISEISGGDYFSPRFEEVGHTAARISQAMQIGRLSASFKLEKEYYPLLFTLALCLFALEFAFGRWEFAVRAMAWLLLPLVFLPVRASADENIDLTRAVHAYNQGVTKLNQNLQQSAELFQEAIQNTNDGELKKRAFFNLGNVFLRMGDPAQALLSYQQALDTHSPDQKFEASADQRISENIVLATKLAEQIKQQQKKGEGDPKEEDEKKKGQNQDPNGPRKDYQPEMFDDTQKQRVFDLISGEEQQILQRLQEQKNQKHVSKITEKTW